MKKTSKFSVKPDWDEIEKVRNESTQFLQTHGLSDDTVHALSMIISELIENGIKYGNFTRDIAVHSKNEQGILIKTP